MSAWACARGRGREGATAGPWAGRRGGRERERALAPRGATSSWGRAAAGEALALPRPTAGLA
eukprot:10539976-Lingulodinium_polyedra.AAC.1